MHGYFLRIHFISYSDQNHGKLLPSRKVSPCGDGHADMGLEGKSVHSSRVDRFDCCQFLFVPEERKGHQFIFIHNQFIFIHKRFIKDVAKNLSMRSANFIIMAPRSRAFILPHSPGLFLFNRRDMDLVKEKWGKRQDYSRSGWRLPSKALWAALQARSTSSLEADSTFKS